MIIKDECFYIGYVKKSHKTIGEVEITLDVDNPQQYKKKESFLLEIHQNLVPFFVQSIQIRPGSAIVHFQNVNTPLEAEQLIGAQVYLPLSELPPLKGKKQFYYHEIIGYNVVDKTHGNIGTVQNVYDNKFQAFFSILYNEKEILVPAIDEFIEKIDRTTKTLHLQCPEGLIDIYL